MSRPKTSTGKQNKIVITNDKGRLSKADIEKMVREAENYKEEDDKQRERIEAKNKLESYTYQIIGTVDDEAVKSKITEADRTKILDKARETLTWLENNQLAEKDEFDDRYKELEGICRPIMTKLYQQNAGGAPPGGAQGGPRGSAASGDGPNIEEVD